MNYTYAHLRARIAVSELRILFANTIDEFLGPAILGFDGHHCEARAKGPGGELSIIIRCTFVSRSKVLIAHSTYLNGPAGVEYWVREAFMYALLKKYGGYLTDDAGVGKFKPVNCQTYKEWYEYRTRRVPKLLKLTIPYCLDAHQSVKKYVLARDARLKKMKEEAERRKEA